MKRRRLAWFPSRLRGWRAAPIAALAMLSLALLTPPVDAIAPEDLDRLLLALSVRPWWGDPPALALVGLDGQRYSLDGLRGRVVLLYFWATW
jgi:hypothetical protein